MTAYWDHGASSCRLDVTISDVLQSTGGCWQGTITLSPSKPSIPLAYLERQESRLVEWLDPQTVAAIPW